jgi:hypothetical protein
MSPVGVAVAEGASVSDGGGAAVSGGVGCGAACPEQPARKTPKTAAVRSLTTT